MGFAPAFPRPFSATFDRRAAAASWWLLGGVAAANAVAVYQPIRAASLEASYVNLANPGTYDAAPGVAPTFNAATGWTFNGSTTQLTTGLVPGPTGWSLLVGVSITGGGGAGAGRAVDNNNVGFGVMPIGLWIANGGTLIASPAVGASIAIVGFAAKTGYRNGVEIGTIGAGSAPALPIYIGNNSARTRGLAGTISALAIYNTTLSAAQVALISAAMAAL